MRKLRYSLALLLACVLLAASPFTALAVQLVDSSDHVHDLAGVLGGNRTSFNQQAGDISSQYGLDIVVVLTDDLDGEELRDYPTRFFQGNGFGQGADGDGIILVIHTEDRSLNNYRQGTGDYYINDANALAITTNVHQFVREGDYAGAVEAFLSYVELRCSTVASNPAEADSRDITGVPAPDQVVEGGVRPAGGTQGGVSFNFNLGGNVFVTSALYALIVAVLAAIVVAVMQKSGEQQESISEGKKSYAVGDVNVSDKKDTFLNTNTARSSKDGKK